MEQLMYFKGKFTAFFFFAFAATVVMNTTPLNKKEDLATRSNYTSTDPAAQLLTDLSAIAASSSFGSYGDFTGHWTGLLTDVKDRLTKGMPCPSQKFIDKFSQTYCALIREVDKLPPGISASILELLVLMESVIDLFNLMCPPDPAAFCNYINLN